MLVANARRFSPANEMILKVLLKNTTRRSTVVVFELPEFLLSELVCITVEDGTTPEVVKDFFVRGILWRARRIMYQSYVPIVRPSIAWKDLAKLWQLRRIMYQVYVPIVS